MAPKPFEYNADGTSMKCPASPTVSVQDEKQVKQVLPQAKDAQSSNTPLSLVVLGIFGQGGEWDEEEEDYKTPPMTRYRLKTTDPDDEEYEAARFVPVEGLVAEDGPHEFYHNDLSDDEDESDKIGDRAVLLQSIENYEAVSKNPNLKAYFHLADKEYSSEDQPVTLTDHELLKERALEDPRFGEQLIVEGATPHDVSLGDIFEVAGGESPLKLQVTCPRKPCYYLDKKNKTPMGSKGIKQHATPTGLAGWFTSVLVEGELKDGMKLVRTQHPYPKWTLANLSQALYGGEGDPKALLRGAASWGRSKEELQELIDNPILCGEEWKDELQPLMDKIVEEEGISGQLESSMSSFVESFTFMFGQLCALPTAACMDFGCFDIHEDDHIVKWTA
jgi:MOSC domain-containing protein YiiM